MEVFCDRHPLQKMSPGFVITHRESGHKADAFKCPQCSRHYIVGNLGYVDYNPANGQMTQDPSLPQLFCSRHPERPLRIAHFDLQGDASVRTWRCAAEGCVEEKVTTGEGYWS